jgi:hypothetical protein
MRVRSWRLAVLAVGTIWVLVQGCQMISDRLTRWQMLDQEALADPVQAVGGDAVVFQPPSSEQGWDRRKLAAASPNDLVLYYAPILVQQRIPAAAQRYPYPPEYDLVGSAHLKPAAEGKLKAYVAGQSTVYAIYHKVPIAGRPHVQLTYTAWYPAHPRMKAIDLEAADIDSCVLRLTLDAEHAPLFYETIAACGCFHKVFVQRWVEEAAAREFGRAEKGKKFVVERSVKEDIDWEVAGVVDEPRARPARPGVFLKAGDHKVIGMGSAARLRVPAGADTRAYVLADYAELYAVAVDGAERKAPFFDLGKGGKVWGAERREGRVLSLLGMDSAGQPRANDQIKLHFDQSTWGDATIYTRFLRLPPGVL